MARSRAAPAPARSAASAAPRPRPSSSSPPPAASSTSSGSGSSSSWFGSRPAAPAPAQHNAAPPPAMHQPSSGGGMMSGLLGSVVQGAALGTGSAIAHRAVDSFMGPRETRVVHEHQGAPEGAPAPAPMQAMPAAEGPCGDRMKQFAECMSKYGDMGACQPYYDAMQQCKSAFA